MHILDLACDVDLTQFIERNDRVVGNSLTIKDQNMFQTIVTFNEKGVVRNKGDFKKLTTNCGVFIEFEDGRGFGTNFTLTASKHIDSEFLTYDFNFVNPLTDWMYYKDWNDKRGRVSAYVVCLDAIKAILNQVNVDYTLARIEDILYEIVHVAVDKNEEQLKQAINSATDFTDHSVKIMPL